MTDPVIRPWIDASPKIEAQALLDGRGFPMEEHDRWFRQQVKSAVEEADRPGAVFIPHTQVRGRWAAKRKELAQRVATRQRKQN